MDVLSKVFLNSFNKFVTGASWYDQVICHWYRSNVIGFFFKGNLSPIFFVAVMKIFIHIRGFHPTDYGRLGDTDLPWMSEPLH